MASPPPNAAPASGLPVRRFSTDAIEPRLRHAAWSAQGWPSVAPAVEAVAEPGFEARSETLLLGPLSLIYGHYGTQAITRSAERLRHAPLEHLNVAVMLTGTMSGSWGRLRPGEVGLVDMDRPFHHRSTTGTMAIVAVPRPVALEYGLDPHLLHGAVIGRERATLFRSHLLRIRRAAHLIAPSDAPRLAGTLIDLLAIGLSSAGCIAPAPRAQAPTLKLRAEALIASGVADPRLDAAFLASALGVSRASLYRQFAGDGGVQRRIRSARLTAAAAALATGDDSVAAVAERFGFGDPARFSRRFREAHGVSPSDWRAGARPR